MRCLVSLPSFAPAAKGLAVFACVPAGIASPKHQNRNGLALLDVSDWSTAFDVSLDGHGNVSLPSLLRLIDMVKTARACFVVLHNPTPFETPKPPLPEGNGGLDYER